MLEILRNSEFSINYLKNLREALLNNLPRRELTQEPKDRVKRFALVYASLNVEINSVECIFDKVARREAEMERWGRALEAMSKGNWDILSREIRKDARKLVGDFKSWEKVNIGHSLEILANLI